ncbi:trehalose synthase (ADP-glucose) [Desulfosoma caldarium]|uniref:Trehalose synthase (ADP-glucose) n=2 Tax=Desulfosoma caldarium TaxID=610254 RepID=A0A3N1VQL3_9BACT|nr:trehalose synthase (ADP-glucose) [Desulfosoma caldarium]
MPDTGVCPRIDWEGAFSAERLAAYASLVDQEKMDELLSLGRDLRGVKVQQINSARSGGGVAEMLRSLVPFERALGLDVTWDVIRAEPSFFIYTKTVHNFLQGRPNVPDLAGTKVYWDTNRQNYAAVREDADIIVVHDPQPAGLIKFAPEHVRRRQKWIWRCHIHLSREHQFVLDFIRSLTEEYDLVVFSAAKFLPRWKVTSAVILPYIDPLSDKNRDLPPEQVREICSRYGVVDMEAKPLIVLVSRFDPFKGHRYALEAFRLVRQETRCQLLMVGGTASDDPENEAIFAELKGEVEGLPDVHLLNLPVDSHIEVNAFQRAARIILQPSIKEGFGLTVSEGMWKEKPVIGGDVGGIPSQITDGYNGFLVPPGKKGVEEMADRVNYLLKNPGFAREMGKRGKEAVKERFLLTRGVLDELKLIRGLLEL